VIALVFKRLIDIAVSSFALIILAPALLAIAVALKLEEPKASVILSQTRIGRDGVPFRLLKFRTFRTSADGSLQLGSVGHFIRVTALDELPQFLNVLKGEMSLVGPRPIRPVEPIQTAWWSSHSFAPGLTGPAQIGDIELSVQDREKLDMWYEENWSPTLDIRIVVRTLTALFRT
jgi:lipopolysaccharide/colanic/teichoic acid biosynthesis glycosyltransferase